MSNNSENDRSVTSNKMYPIDLAPQKITIVKSVPNSDGKMTHLVAGQPKTTGPSPMIGHTGPLGLMRPSTQIISSNVSSQPHMIVSSSPILAGTQIVSQGSQGITQNTQIISQSQLIGPGGQLGPGTQIISQGTQLNANPGAGNTGGNLVTVSTSGPVLNVGGQLISGGGNLVVSSSVRTLPPSVRVLPPLQHHNARPVLSNVSLNNSTLGSGNGVMMSKTAGSHVSHVPRGLAAGASLAVPRVATRPVATVPQTMPMSTLGTAWSSAARGVRGAVVYSARAPRAPLTAGPLLTRAPAPATLGGTVSSPAPAHTPLSTIVTVPSTSVLTSSGVITAGARTAPRVLTPAPAPAPRPMPLVQRNYQPATKLLGVANVGVRPVGNSAPSQLYYEVSRPAPPQSSQRPLTPFHQMPLSNQVNVLNARLSPERRIQPAPASLPPAQLPRPTILRKRDFDGSPTKNAVGAPLGYSPPCEDAVAWEPRPQSPNEHLLAPADNDAGGGSTTESAASSPAPEDDPPSPPAPSRVPAPAPAPAPETDVSPRKKPRKQALSNEVRQCEYVAEEPSTPPPLVIKPPAKRPQLSSSYVCGWRATALHFVRPADVRRREARPRDILAIANQKHVLATAEGWKVHHLTAQMDDLVSLEADVSEQLSGVLRTLETAHGKAQIALAPHSHALLELVKGNIQRSRIVCEGVQEAREDILRVFTHRTFVSDILSRQADKRCFRKHRSQS